MAQTRNILFYIENKPSYSRYNELAVEKQRVEQENNSLRLFVEEERKELEDMRRQQQVC